VLRHIPLGRNEPVGLPVIAAVLLLYLSASWQNKRKMRLGKQISPAAVLLFF